jgi:hypothetical protein
MKNLFNIGIGLLIILVVLLMIGQNNILSIPEELLHDAESVGGDLMNDVESVGGNLLNDVEGDFSSPNMHSSNFDVLNILSSNGNDSNDKISSHLFDLY